MDGLNISTSNLIGGLEFARRTQDRAKQDAMENEAKIHLQGFQELGMDYAPPDNDYDAKAFNAAQVDYVTGLAQKEEVKQLMHERVKKDIDFQFEQVTNFGKKAEGILALASETSDPNERMALQDNALKMYEQAYESFADGNDMEIEGNTIIITGPDGNESRQTFETREKMFEHMDNMIRSVSDKTAFAQTAMAARQGVTQHNASRIMEPKHLMNPKTGKLVTMVYGLVDPSTGKPLNKEIQGHRAENGAWFTGPGGKSMSYDEVVNGGYVDLETNKEIADILKKKADTSKTSMEGLSSEEKLANLFQRAYGLDLATATDEVLKLKKQTVDAKMLLKVIQDQFGEMDEDTMQAIKDLDLDDYFSGKPMSQKMADLKKEKAKASTGGKGVPGAKRTKQPTENHYSEYKKLRGEGLDHREAVNALKTKYTDVVFK